MAAGKAVVASDTDGPHMLIEHGTSGLLFPVGNVPELSDAVSRLLQSPAERARIGERASTRATEFSVEHMVREVEQVWKGVLEDHSFG
jgi:glycosyltransferase involved in cell wall biosynthesis